MSLTALQVSSITASMDFASMLAKCKDFGAVFDGRIDLRGAMARFDHRNLDLSRFIFDESNLTGSRFTNCSATGASFRRVTLRDVRFANEPGFQCSFESADFTEAVIETCYFGPKTLNLRNASFRKCELRKTKFMLGSLQKCDFYGAKLADVDLRGADLTKASFAHASLDRVCLEKACLLGADFSEAQLRRMAQWGEPDFRGSIIDDTLRYRYAIIDNPAATIRETISILPLNESQAEQAHRFGQAVEKFAAKTNEAMLIFDEYSELISLELFVAIVKLAKELNGRKSLGSR